MTAFGTFEELMADDEPEQQKIAVRLRQIIYDLHPETVEVVRLGDRAATYGLGPKKMSEGYCYIMPQSSYVNLGFYKGAVLSDPAGLLEGTGKQLRHIKIRTIEQCDDSGIRSLMEAAISERRVALSPPG